MGALAAAQIASDPGVQKQAGGLGRSAILGIVVVICCC